MPFGMENSGATLVRGMRKLLQDMDNVECCIDDLIVYTKDWVTHLQVLDKLLEKLRQAGLVIRPTTQGCELDRFSTEFEFKRYLQIRVQVGVLRILFFEFRFEFGKNDQVRVRSPGLYRSQ